MKDIWRGEALNQIKSLQSIINFKIYLQFRIHSPVGQNGLCMGKKNNLMKKYTRMMCLINKSFFKI